MDASFFAKFVLGLIALMFSIFGVVAITHGFQTDLIETVDPRIDDMSKFFISVGLFLCGIAVLMATATYFA